MKKAPVSKAAFRGFHLKIYIVKKCIYYFVAGLPS